MDTYQIAGVFDTETTTLKNGEGARAFPCLFIYNDLSGVDLRTYDPDQDHIEFYRTSTDFLSRLLSVIDTFANTEYVPIICSYNLMFDLQPLLYELNKLFDITAIAQSSTSAYTVDLYDQETAAHLLRFWDCFYLDNNGLASMGRTAGLAKAIGDWDYSLVRHSATPLTDTERGYAGRDVQVIPAFLRFLLESNSWLTPEMLGVSVLTKTSIVRKMAQYEIGNLKFKSKRGTLVPLYMAFVNHATREQAQTYEQHALRKACFYGGYVFTAAATASQTVHNVYSLDVTSMHHLYINGWFQPQHFRTCFPAFLDQVLDTYRAMSVSRVLENYGKPFPVAFHAAVHFSEIRLKRGSVFEALEIGYTPQSKFSGVYKSEFEQDARNEAAENDLRASGYVNKAAGAVFAYGKLYSAESAVIFCNELEYWALSQVYEWSECHTIEGEATTKFTRPPDYVTLQSNVLFERKQAAKTINKNYQEGNPYPLEIPDSIPAGIAAALRSGEGSNSFFESYYNSNVKGSFNGIYGTQSMNIYRPDFCVSEGELAIDDETRLTPENFGEKMPDKCKVLYTYGMRIVGGSRIHLIIAMSLLWDMFGRRIKITGGDTDSLKIATDGVTGEELLDALDPLHRAAKAAIDWVQQRVRSTFPEHASTLEGIGVFEVENASEPYTDHIELWNKARVSRAQDGHISITCAGLSRPAGAYTIEDALEELTERNGFTQAVTAALGYNCYIDNCISHSLQRTYPLASERVTETVTDYLGNSCEVNEYQSIALYDAGRWLGDLEKQSNKLNYIYQKARSREPYIEPRTLTVRDGRACVVSNIDGRIIIN